jgi:hypothetical protein
VERMVENWIPTGVLKLRVQKTLRACDVWGKGGE